MGFNIGKAFSNFGKGMKRGFTKFGKQAGHDFSSAGTWIKTKALPTVEKFAGDVGKGINYAMPVIGAIAPELLPFAMGASKIAGIIGKGAGITRKGIQSGENVVERLKRGDVAGATQAGRDLRGGAMSLGRLGN